VSCYYSSPHIINCLFDSNTSPGVTTYDTPSAPVISGCTFRNGGESAIRCLNGEPEISNCLIWNNYDPWGGGSIQLEYADATIVNCTIVGNTSEGGGGGIVCVGSSPTIANCIVRDNLPAEITGGGPAVTCSNVRGGFAGEGNIDADPLYIDPEADDYRIGPVSPCIDAGSNGQVPSGITTDIDGNPRFIDDPFTDDTGVGDPPIVDMGMNEYQADVGGLWVVPADALISEGPNGGPFTPASLDYRVCNLNAVPTEFSASNSQPWVELSSTGGIIPALGTADVTVYIGDYANSLPNGLYEDTVEFVNETTHEGDTTRPVSLKVGAPTPVIIFDLDQDPGWTVEGMWEFGQPTGQGGDEFGYPDPTGGYTGDNVYGYNLNGDYPVDMGGPFYLTTTAIDCSELTDVWLHFRRWLNCDKRPYVHSTLDASVDGENWTRIWENGYEETTENSWSEQAYDLSEIADNQATLQLRWGHRKASAIAQTYSGWNIDDIEIWGVEPTPECPADFDGDGNVDTADLLHLLGAWGTPDGDVDGDGDTDTADLLALLGAWGDCP
jgi:hypothetical protein